MSGKPAKHLKDKVKFSQLRSFTSVAETGSFSEAALLLNVSQSTVSHSVAALEDALGVMLIHRGRQGASLTPVGSRIFEQAKQALGLIDAMGQEATRARGVDGGLVRIAAFRSLASEIVPQAIAHLHQRHPNIQITITEFDGVQEIVDTLREGKADLSMATLLTGEGFESFQIMEDPFVALLPPNQPDLRTTLTWADLRKYPLITSSSDCCKDIPNWLSQVQPPIEVDYFISNDSTSVSMTRQGLGITLLPKLAAQPVPPAVRIAALPFSESRPLGISWLCNTLLTPATYAFLETCQRLFSATEKHRFASDSLNHPGLTQPTPERAAQDTADIAQYGEKHLLDGGEQETTAPAASRTQSAYEKAAIPTPWHH